MFVSKAISSKLEKAVVWNLYQIFCFLMQIKDDTKRSVYCALIRLLQEKDLSVRVWCSNSLFFYIFGHLICFVQFSHWSYTWIVLAGSLSVPMFSYWRCKLFRARFYWSSSNLLGFMFQVDWGSPGIWLKSKLLLLLQVTV